LKTNTKRLDELTDLVDEKRELDEQLVSRKAKAVRIFVFFPPKNKRISFTYLGG